MEASAFAVERQAQASQGPLTGRATLSAPPVLVTHLLAGRPLDIRSQHGGIQLSVSAQAQQVSLSRREADVALRLVRPQEPSSVIRQLGQMPFALYASQDYEALHRPEDWRFIAYDAQFADMPQQQWLLGIAGRRAVACELSDIGSHLAAEAAPFSRDIRLVVHRDLRHAKPVRAVMDFVAQVITQTAGLGLPAAAGI